MEEPNLLRVKASGPESLLEVGRIRHEQALLLDGRPRHEILKGQRRRGSAAKARLTGGKGGISSCHWEHLIKTQWFL